MSLILLICMVLNTSVLPSQAAGNVEVEGTSSLDNLIMFHDSGVQEYITCNDESELSISKKHVKYGDCSLQWYVAGDGVMEIATKIPYKKTNSGNKMDTFIAYLYNEKAVDAEMEFSFYSKNVYACKFDVNMNFTGWRAVWVTYQRDMEGNPNGNMDSLKIQAPEGLKNSNIYFSMFIMSTSTDGKKQTRNYLTPYVNAETENHWMSLYSFDQAYRNHIDSIASENSPSENEIEDAEIIEERYNNYLKEQMSTPTFEQVKNKYDAYGIINDNGYITGATISYSKADTMFDEFSDKEEIIGLKKYDITEAAQTLYNLACFYLQAPDGVEKDEAKEMYMNLFLHIIDQEYDVGSGLGTVTHLGYSLQQHFYSAIYLMRNEFSAENKKKAQEIVNWFAGTGRIFYNEIEADSVNVDVLYTELFGILGGILMIDDAIVKTMLLKEYQNWLTYACDEKQGLSGPFKADGSGMHHTTFYPAYTKTGLIGLTPIIYLISRTEFALPATQHEIVKKAVLLTRIYSNEKDYLVSVSGRHPTGVQTMSPIPLKYMALAGEPGASRESTGLDAEVAAAYLRVASETDDMVAEFKALGIQEEDAPEGNWALNFACLGIQRRDEWLVGVRGYNKYIPANEAYSNANLYGRYMSNGSIMILSKGDPITNEASGYSHDGWDWSCWPGTTSIHLPVELVKSKFETSESLRSDESYAGALSCENQNGMFAMKVHESKKYNDSFRANISVFMFDNRIICLGSDIVNTDAIYPTYTTLFQNHHEENEMIYINSENAITDMNYINETTTSGVSFLFDNKQNGYILPKATNLIVTQGTQNSLAQNDGTDTTGDFSKAVINHGVNPSGSEYEYMLLVDTSLEETKNTALRISEDSNAVYEVIQKDNKAHIVRDIETDITGYVFFEANTAVNKGRIKSIDTPSMVMISEKGENEIVVSVCDPDFRFDNSGEESDWKEAKSPEHTLELVLLGSYQKEGENDKVQLTENENGTTTLLVTSNNAETVEFSLKEKSSQTTIPEETLIAGYLTKISSNKEEEDWVITLNQVTENVHCSVKFEGSVVLSEYNSIYRAIADVMYQQLQDKTTELFKNRSADKLAIKKYETKVQLLMNNVVKVALNNGLNNSLYSEETKKFLSTLDTTQKEPEEEPGGDVSEGDVSGGDVSGGDVSGGDVPGGDVPLGNEPDEPEEPEEPDIPLEPDSSENLETVTEELKNSGNIIVNSEGSIVVEDTTYEVDGKIVGGQIIKLEAKDGSGTLEIPVNNIVIRPISEADAQIQEQVKEKACKEAARIMVNTGLDVSSTKVIVNAFDVVVPDTIKNNISAENTVTIIFNVAGYKKGDIVKVLHKPEDKEWELLNGTVVEDNKVAVTLSSFSPIVFLKLSQIQNNNSSKNDNVSDTSVQEEEEELVEVPRIYVVVRGDSLSRIAASNGLTLRQLLMMNPQIKNPNRIYPGQQIVVGKVLSNTASVHSAEENARYYQVKKGDSLYKIAVKNHLSLKELCIRNPEIFRQKYIFAGQKIRVH